MTQGAFIGFFTAASGIEEDRLLWHRESFAREVAGLDSVLGVRRYRISAHQVPLPGSELPQYRYMTVFDIADLDVAGKLIGDLWKRRADSAAKEDLLSLPAGGGLYEVARAQRTSPNLAQLVGGAEPGIYVALSNQHSNATDDMYAEWYDGHVGDLLATPGMFAATRFQRAAANSELEGLDGYSAYRYLSLYITDVRRTTDALAEGLKRAGETGLAEASAEAGMAVGDVFDFSSYVQIFYDRT